MAQPSLFT